MKWQRLCFRLWKWADAGVGIEMVCVGGRDMVSRK